MGIEIRKNETLVPFVWTNDNNGTNGAIIESIEAPSGKGFFIETIKVHIVEGTVSTGIDFTVRVSNTTNSEVDFILISQTLSARVDIFKQFTSPFRILSDNQLVVSCPVLSGVTTIGIEIDGWAVVSDQ